MSAHVKEMVRCWSNLSVYMEVARSGPHRADGVAILVVIDRLHRSLYKTIPHAGAGIPRLSASDDHR